MVVTDIVVHTRGRRQIYLNGAYAFSLYAGEVTQYGLKEGQSVSSELVGLILTECVGVRAKKRAMHLLEKRDYPEAQLRAKLLAGGYPESVIEDTIAYLNGYHYLDDTRFARQFIQFRMEQLSRRQIVMKLTAKGISKDTVEAVYGELEALGEYEPTAQEEQLARQQLEKKLRNVDVGGMERGDWNKIYQFLARKGFSTSVIMQVIKQYQSEYTEF